MSGGPTGRGDEPTTWPPVTGTFGNAQPADVPAWMAPAGAAPAVAGARQINLNFTFYPGMSPEQILQASREFPGTSPR